MLSQSFIDISYCQISVYRLSHAWIICLLADTELTPSKSIRDISQDNYNVRRLYKRATKMASLSIPHSNFLFLGQFQYWSTHYQLRSMARYVTPLHNHKRSYIDSCLPAEACGLQDDVIVLCLASSTTPRRRNLLVALAQYTVTDFWS